MKSKGLYQATIIFTVDIEADNKKVAEYIAKNAVPNHFSFSSGGLDGCGSGKFGKAEKPIVVAVR